MWEDAELEVSGKIYQVCAKVYEVGSIFGIRRGRVSKIGIQEKGVKAAKYGKTFWNYDRGWDGPKAPRAILDAIIARWPEPTAIK